MALRSERFGPGRRGAGVLLALHSGMLLVAASACDGDDPATHGASTSGGGGASEPVCIGVRPPGTAWDALPNGPGPSDPLAHTPKPVLGAPSPSWALSDFQPQSCGYGTVYGQDVFVGHVTLVALFSAACTFCQSQTVGLERMRNELDVGGYDVQFLVLNIPGAQPFQQELVDRCGLPLFQDRADIKAMEAYGGNTDDLFVYDSDGNLAVYLRNDGTLRLSTDDGYAKVRAAVLAAD